MVVKSAIRHLANTRNGNILLAALFEQTVTVWDMENGNKLSELNTILNFGGERLAISDDEKICFTGSWTKVSAYSLADGQLRWQRKDIKHLQHLKISPHNTAYCCLDDGPCQVVDINSGKTIVKLRGLRDIFFDPYNGSVLLDKAVPELYDKSLKKIGNIARETFAILDASFSPRHLAVSESGGNVRFFDSSTGETVWSYSPPKGEHVLNLCFSDETNNFYGVIWNYRTGVRTSLIKFDTSDQTVMEITLLNDAWVTSFCGSGKSLVTASGDVVQTVSGRILGTLQFPQREYEK